VISSIQENSGYSQEALREWFRHGDAAEMEERLSTDERAWMKEPERENRELRRANETVREGSVCSKRTIIEYSPEYSEDLTSKAATVFGIDRSEVTEIHRKAVHLFGREAAALENRLFPQADVSQQDDLVQEPEWVHARVTGLTSGALRRFGVLRVGRGRCPMARSRYLASRPEAARCGESGAIASRPSRQARDSVTDARVTGECPPNESTVG
jgi:hypothetical protein